MDLYNFLNHNNTGFLTNFLSDLLKGPVKFVEYRTEKTIKIFAFGLNGFHFGGNEIFEFLITPDNKIGFYFHNLSLHSIYLGNSSTNSHVELVRLNLLQSIREIKINQII
jgi:hypothetical protein